jgi:hypothetical protein
VGEGIGVGFDWKRNGEGYMIRIGKIRRRRGRDYLWKGRGKRKED